MIRFLIENNYLLFLTSTMVSGLEIVCNRFNASRFEQPKHDAIYYARVYHIKLYEYIYKLIHTNWFNVMGNGCSFLYDIQLLLDSL